MLVAGSMGFLFSQKSCGSLGSHGLLESVYNKNPHFHSIHLVGNTAVLPATSTAKTRGRRRAAAPATAGISGGRSAGYPEVAV